jgi:hypothetical protein
MNTMCDVLRKIGPSIGPLPSEAISVSCGIPDCSIGWHLNKIKEPDVEVN